MCKLFLFANDVFSFFFFSSSSRVSFDGGCLGLAILLREAVETSEWSSIQPK